jgi:hypothetical protein
MSDRLLTDEEKVGLWIRKNVCTKCPVKNTVDCDYHVCGDYLRWKEWITKTANYYETVVIPERERKLIEEIDRHSAGCEYSHQCGTTYCPEDKFSNNCLWWQQLKQKRGV